MTPADLTALKALLTAPPSRTLAVAESLTCGQLQAAIGSVSGASAFFLGGITAYTLEQKVKHLGVDRTTAEACNCVSEATAREMARGALAMFGADLAVATTGYAEADPTGGITEPFAWWALAGRAGMGVSTEALSGRIACPGLSRVAVQAAVTAGVLQALVTHLRSPRG
ncbi:CinA family protein [Synoicihabitans lomoniglobus]|uniref:Nicotinamide-nucleotide amidohydrolase family protein n=1 Tax=Synoicihabitans lomoniglobus TaxID=2909285 RepID=A0AAE9ZT56_9BACT|nr:nicotinamide-nucleotide amidohydrolase family protein [Opitutaceae bacterium LMO-M01]WED63796.1 nicotinamide-nucleotide amidohydrolase family protein [Opitutaceae bacterium LMO-M01]